MKGNLIRKYGGILRKEYIELVVDNFYKVKNYLFLKGDVEQLCDSYLHYDKVINDLNNNISKMKREIVKIEGLKKDIINKSVIELRNEGGLLNWLREMNFDELKIIKNILDIEREFEVVDNERFIEAKRNRIEKVY